MVVQEDIVWFLLIFEFFCFLPFDFQLHSMWLENDIGMFSVLSTLRLILWPSMWFTLANVLCALENSLILLSEVFCTCLLGQFDLWFSSRLQFPYWLFTLDDLSIIESGKLKSILSVSLCISHFRSSNTYFAYLGALMLVM